MNTKILSDEVYNNIFNFWKLQEYFAPADYPKNVHYCNEYGTQKIPLDIYKMQKYDFVNIYFGCYKLKIFVQKMAESCSLNMNKYIDISELSGRFYIFSIQIDLDGKPTQKEGLKISPFFYAIISMMKTGGKNAKIMQKDIIQLNDDINEILEQNHTTILKFEDLNYVKEIIFNKLNIFSEQEIGLESASKKTFAYKGLTKDETTSSFDSFYLDEIELVHKNYKFNEHVSKFITAPLVNNKQKIMIDENIRIMQKWLETDRYPLAKYPSKFSPTLMQQIAINIAISEKDRNEKIFSVNGPPGTGKTTLLKEIIASNVEKLAETLIDYGIDGVNHGGFKKCKIDSASNSRYTEYYYEIPEDITQYGILVVSNNNGAVENITLDLPKADSMRKSKTRTDFFDRNDHIEVYFSAVADELLSGPSSAWGLISARMGRKAYVKEVLKSCIFSKSKKTDDISQKATLDLAKKDSISWEEAISCFKQAKKKVLSFRKEIKNDKQILSSMYQAEADLKKEKSLLNELYSDREEITQKLKDVQERLNANEYNTLHYEEEIKYLKKHTSLFKKLLALIHLGDIGKRIAEKQKQIHELILEHEKLAQDCNLVKEKTKEIHTNIEKQKSKIVSLEKEAYRLRTSIYGNADSLRTKYANNLADRDFYLSIKASENSQNSCPWTFPAYDKAREELFFAALQVRKAFILESKCIKRNLYVYESYNEGSYTSTEKFEIFPHLFNALSIVVPVLSSTFASVGRFLKHAGNKSLGMLVIDESGQALPQSALGALYRTKCAIVVGDPLQVEPVVTIPQVLIDILADSTGVSNDYKTTENSVQTFADYMNEFNGMIGERQVGCPLVVHRRCIEPMFSISNIISYDNRMFNQTYKKEEFLDANKPFLIKKSGWIDIKGPENGTKDHFVKEQAIKVCQLLENAAQIYNEFFKTDDKIFIITPFKTVSESMKKYIIKHFSSLDVDMESLNTWVKNCVGTVHTFQGKDANEVLFVLGCSAESTGAMNWVVKNPNILNVACTRAKYRIAFIGNIEDWKDNRFFNDFVPKLIDNIII